MPSFAEAAMTALGAIEANPDAYSRWYRIESMAIDGIFGSVSDGFLGEILYSPTPAPPPARRTAGECPTW